jgi:hypothetical protein
MQTPLLLHGGESAHVRRYVTYAALRRGACPDLKANYHVPLTMNELANDEEL